MTVNDVLATVQEIRKLIHIYDKGELNANHFDELIELIKEYEEELLKKKVV